MSNHSNFKPVLFAFLGNFFIAISKFVAAFFSGSAAMFSEGLHSIADTINQVFLMIGLNRAKKPASNEHQFGYGQEQFFWSLISAFGILSIGSALSIQKGFNSLSHPEVITNTTLIFFVLALALVVESYTLYVAVRYLNLKKGKLSLFNFIGSSAESASITVLFEDAGAIIGLLIAFGGITLSIVTGNPFFDAISSIIIGILLGIIAIFLLFKNKSLLTGPSHGGINEIVKEVFISHPAIENFHDLRSIIFDPGHVIVMADIEFKEEFIYNKLSLLGKSTKKEYTEKVIKNIGLLTDQIETQIRIMCPEVQEIYLEVEQTKRKIR